MGPIWPNKAQITSTVQLLPTLFMCAREQMSWFLQYCRATASEHAQTDMCALRARWGFVYLHCAGPGNFLASIASGTWADRRKEPCASSTLQKETTEEKGHSPEGHTWPRSRIWPTKDTIYAEVLYCFTWWTIPFIPNAVSINHSSFSPSRKQRRKFGVICFVSSIKERCRFKPLLLSNDLACLPAWYLICLWFISINCYIWQHYQGR